MSLLFFATLHLFLYSLRSALSFSLSPSASVNFATSSYERSNLTSLYNPALTSQSTRTSSVSYSRSFPKIGLNLSSSMNLSQNMRDSTLSVNLPSLSISLNRIYPFKRKKVAGAEKWYEKISFTYSGTLSNSIVSKESEILHTSLVRDWKNGMRHSIPVSATFQFLKNIWLLYVFSYYLRHTSYHVLSISWTDRTTQSLSWPCTPPLPYLTAFYDKKSGPFFYYLYRKTFVCTLPRYIPASLIFLRQMAICP